MVDGVVGAAKGVTKKAQALSARTGAAVKDPLSDPVLAIVGLLTLASALLGTLVVYRVSKGHLPR